MHNFTFLKKEKKYSTFTNACIEAEKSLMVSNSTTAILCRRGMELAIKWVFAYDNDLDVPYQDTLSTLIHDYIFRDIIGSDLFDKLRYIQKLGNVAVHSSSAIKRQQAVLALRNLFDFACFIDYCYSDEYMDGLKFDEKLLPASHAQVKTNRKAMADLQEKLSQGDRKLADLVAENQALREENAAKRIVNRANREYDVDNLSEFETRKLYIDIEIQLKGWTVGRDCLEEVEVTGMPNASKLGYVDYVLYDDDAKPIAIIEAKKTCIDPKIGKQQALEYAQCLEARYGNKPIIYYTNGFDYYIWDDENYPPRIVSGINTKAELQWSIYKGKNKLKLINLHIKDEISNRGYQKMAIGAICDTLTNGHRKALLVMATGSGKTRTAISLVDVLSNKGWVKNVLFLADRRELVKQAKNNFKNLMPELSLCNLLDSKDNPESRMVFSTYPTMMNAIDETKADDGSMLFTSGHFDMIIIDESHRSIYKKYQAIFNYFDSILVGLTATPKSDIHKNTYTIFDLEDKTPTFSYDMSEAVAEHFLVPYRTVEIKDKFIEEGINYDELSDEEKDEFEDKFDDGVKEISSSALNNFLFNSDTVDKVLQKLMQDGIKIKGGDMLGKTIIFAKNQKHANYIIERFDIIFPHLKGSFARTIHNKVKYVDSLIDSLKDKDKMPQIAVSVDMLDTGIDIPELVNLVFFKKVRSKAKFYQMIGRGTRLCPDIFGMGHDKTEFVIFDYCTNFEFFRAERNEREAPAIKSLTENLFNTRMLITKELQHMDYQTDILQVHRQELITGILTEVCAVDEDRFDARLKLKYLHRYNKATAFSNILELDLSDTITHIAPLITSKDDDELAKRFDLLMYSIEYSALRGISASKQKRKVITTAQLLSVKGNIEKVKAQIELIKRVQTDEFWQDADIFDYEVVRKAFRDLIKYIDSDEQAIYFTNFEDEFLSIEEHAGEFHVNEMHNYKKKVNHYLNQHKDDMVIYKLRHNRALNVDDMKHLEDILWNQLGSKDDYEKEFGNEPLQILVRKIVGLDRDAVNQSFSSFLSDESLNQNQMEFVKLIVNYVVENGIINKNILIEHPFNNNGGITQLFKDKKDVVIEIIKTIDQINIG